MAQSYFELMTNKVVTGPPYLQACNAQIDQCRREDDIIRNMEMEIRELELEIAVEMENTRKKILFATFKRDILRLQKEENMQKKNLVARTDFKKNYFKNKTDVSSGGGSGSLRKF